MLGFAFITKLLKYGGLPSLWSLLRPKPQTYKVNVSQCLKTYQKFCSNVKLLVHSWTFFWRSRVLKLSLWFWGKRCYLPDSLFVFVLERVQKWLETTVVGNYKWVPTRQEAAQISRRQARDTKMDKQKLKQKVAKKMRSG